MTLPWGIILRRRPNDRQRALSWQRALSTKRANLLQIIPADFPNLKVPEAMRRHIPGQAAVLRQTAAMGVNTQARFCNGSMEQDPVKPPLDINGILFESNFLATV
jgi:hypothetical protein